MEGKSTEKLLHHLGIQIPYRIGGESGVKHQEGTSGNVQHRPSQSFIHGNEGVTVPGNAAAVPQSLSKSLAQDNPGILHGVMAVHNDVSHHLQIQVNAGMDGGGRDHVVEKADAGVGVANTTAVQVQLCLNVRFFGDTVDLCCAHNGSRPFPLSYYIIISATGSSVKIPGMFQKRMRPAWTKDKMIFAVF